MWAGAYTATRAALSGSESCAARWVAYEASLTADFITAGASGPQQATAPPREAIDAQVADGLLETESQVVPLCRVQATRQKQGNRAKPDASGKVSPTKP